MVVLTVLMLVAFLCLVPLRMAVAFCLDLDKKCLYARLTLFWVPVFKEKFEIIGKYLVCKGTVKTNLDLTTLNTKAGAGLTKAIVLDSVNVTFALDYTKANPLVMPALETVLFAVTSVACAFSHCRVRTSSAFSLANAVFGEVVISTTLAEVLLALVKEKVNLWTNKLAQ